MTHLFLYHNGRRGDVMLCRALYRAVLAHGGFEVTLGVCRTDRELVTDLAGPRCRIVVGDYGNTPFGAPFDLAAYCPSGAIPIDIWLGGTNSQPSRQWPDVVDAFHRDLRRLGIAAVVAEPTGEVPMLDFAGPIEVPALRRRAVFVDNARTEQESSYFVYDLARLARVLPDHDLLCTAAPAARAPNLVDIGALSWPQRSRLSEGCEALVGSTFDPFVVTMTEANRWRPKALCGHDARVTPPLWDYAGNPMELLTTMDELVDFLLANVVEGVGR